MQQTLIDGFQKYCGVQLYASFVKPGQSLEQSGQSLAVTRSVNCGVIFQGLKNKFATSFFVLFMLQVHCQSKLNTSPT